MSNSLERMCWLEDIQELFSTCKTYFSSSLTASAGSAELIWPQAAGAELLYYVIIRDKVIHECVQSQDDTAEGPTSTKPCRE